jgi:hypothetical protein
MLSENAPEIALLPRCRNVGACAPCECCRQSGGTPGTTLANLLLLEAVMSHVLAPGSIGSFVVGLFEHAFFVIAGFVLMVVGLGLSVTMIMLPVGLPLGLLGLAMVIGGLTVHLNQS